MHNVVTASMQRSRLVRLALGVFMCSFAATSHSAGAASELSQSQAGFYRMKIGSVDVIALSDGTVSLPVHDLLTNVRPGEVDQLLKQAYRHTPLETSVNAYLILSGERRILIDTGAGKLYGPTLNKLPQSLANAGHPPASITDILVTHIHMDHAGGLSDGDRRIYPNAVVHVDRREAEYWLNRESMERAGAELRPAFEFAMAMMAPYQKAGQFKTFAAPAELFPGIRAMPTPGHTPGHAVYALESQQERIFFWGDIMHVAEVQFPNPAITINFDVDSKSAAEQRKRVFAEAAREGYFIAPAHVSFPGVGRLRVDGAGYRWFPIPYVNDAHAGE
jgi:glyoxylase-like metal-dependent hydrolase (beta-lactamase superfamily II)